MAVPDANQVACMVLLGVVIGMQPVMAHEGHKSMHRRVEGVVIDKGGHFAVQTPNGPSHQINPNQSRRHRHAAFKAGDKVSVLFDENNTVMEIHPAGSEGAHQIITGTLIHVGKMKLNLKRRTAIGSIF